MLKFLLLLLAPVTALANQAPAAPVPMAGSDLTSQLGQMLLGLLVVIGLIFALAWGLRRVQQLAPKGGQVIKLVATQTLGPRDRLVLVQVGEEQVLLGLTAGRITPLHVMKEPVQVQQTQAATPEFAQRLMDIMGKDHKDKS